MRKAIASKLSRRFAVSSLQFAVAFLLFLSSSIPVHAFKTLDIETSRSDLWQTFALSDSMFGGYATSDGSVWFFNARGVVRYDGATWQLYTAKDGLLDAPIKAMDQTDAGALWFIAGEFEKTEGISCYADGAWSVYPAEVIGLNDVSDILTAKDGSTWFVGAKDDRSAASRFDGKTWRVYTHRDGLVGWHLKKGIQAENGDLWFSVGRLHKRGRTFSGADDGVLRYDGQTWTSYTTQNGLSHNRIYDLFQSPDGTLWVGTMTGIDRFDRRTWRHHAAEDGLAGRKPQRFTAHNGDVWFHYNRDYHVGVTRYDGEAWQTYTIKDGLADNLVRHIFPAKDGTLWIGTAGGASRFDGKSWMSFTQADGLPGRYVEKIWQVPDGKLWIITGDGKAGTFTGTFAGLETITGILTGSNRSPLAGIGVQVMDQEGRMRAGTTTNADGRYGVQVFPGTYRIYAHGAAPVAVKIGSKETVHKVDLTLTPTLGRLAFRGVLPDRMAAFERAFQEWMAPILKRYGLVAASSQGRATRDSVFSRLFELKTPLEVEKMRQALLADSVFKAAHRRLGTAFETMEQDSLIFTLYETPAGPGRVVFAGPGQRRRTEGEKVRAGQGRGPWRSGDALTGPFNPAVESIFQDRQGNLWFSTPGLGVRRYDGQTWTTFTDKDGLASNRVLAISQDRDGYMWFGTYGDGVSRYDGQTWASFTEENGLPNNQVYAISQDRDGYMWFGTHGGGVSRYDGWTWVTLSERDGLVNSNVHALFLDQRGHLWMGAHGVVSRYDGRTFTHFTREDGLINHNPVLSISQDRDGHMWFAASGGVSRYDGQTFTHFTTEDGLANNEVSSIFEDREGRLWFGTRGGVSRYDGQVWTTFTTKDGLVNNTVRTVFQGREGDLWFGTTGGLSQYGEPAFTSFTMADGLAWDDTYGIFQDRRGHLWISGYAGGVTQYDGRTFTRFAEEDSLNTGHRIYAFAQGRGDQVWAGIHGIGVSFYDGQAWTGLTTADGLADDNIHSLFQDRKGDLWMGAHGVVSRYDGQVFTHFTREDGLASSGPVLSIFQDQADHFWFGTREGVSRYDGKTFTTYTHEDGLAHNSVRSIVQDREGDLWFGTSEGVSRYDGKTFTTYTTKDGLLRNEVRAIVQGRNGHLWFGSRSSGVSRYDGRVFQSLTVQDGLINNTVYGMLEDHSGALWFCTAAGITRFRPPEPVPPRVAIDAVVVDRFTHYEGVTELSIPSSVGQTAFEFHGASLRTRPDAMVYRYRLKGHQEDWTTTGAPRVQYEDLPMGTYTFEVQAVDRDLVYSDVSATVALVVHPPYERIGLIGALGVALVLVAWQTGRVVRRDRRLQEANRKLETTNRAMSEANRELFRANRALQRDRAVERIRGEVQAIERASDFEKVLSLLSEDLRTAGLSFDTCGIGVLDEPVDEPTMAYFEDHGFQHTTYTVDPDGAVTLESYHLSAPFPALNRGAIERFVAGQVWQGRDMDLGAMAEVPIAQYGRLRMTASDRQAFTEEDIDALREFAAAIALGYARYLDFVSLEAANREIREQTERKSAFLASMSHELRTPMNAIIGFTRMVLRRAGDTLQERQRDNLDRVVQSANHLLALINDLLDLSKIEAGRMDVNAEVFNAGKLITSCCAQVEPLVMEKPEVKLTHDLSDDIGEANTDPGRLRQILMNLLSNAIKFTEKGEVAVRASTADGQLAVTVSDTGSGIPPDALDTIFEEFQQVKGSDPQHKGTGLGLPICKGFAELLGGSIRVESEVGKGSTFTIRIPMVYTESGFSTRHPGASERASPRNCEPDG